MYIGIDLGTSGVKTILTDESGKVVDSASSSLTVAIPQPLWSEQNPEDWWTATCATLDELKQRNDLSVVKALGLAGQMHGATLLDKAGRVLRPAILWNDGRSEAQCRIDDRIAWSYGGRQCASGEAAGQPARGKASRFPRPAEYGGRPSCARNRRGRSGRDQDNVLHRQASGNSGRHDWRRAGRRCIRVSAEFRSSSCFGRVSAVLMNFDRVSANFRLCDGRAEKKKCGGVRWGGGEAPSPPGTGRTWTDGTGRTWTNY